jgi:hypothetical protein
MAEALRLLFEWADGNIRLKEARPVAKRAPPPDPPDRQRAADDATGILLELREGDRSIYRRHVGPMFPDSHEVQTGDPKRPFARAPRRKPYTVEIVVPAERATRVVLTERRPEPGAKRGTEPRAMVHVDEPLKRDDSQPEQESS